MKRGYVYLMTNRYRGVLYIGVTSDLFKRGWQHREKDIEGFTKRYNLKHLVWFEGHESMESAILTEKKLKNMSRNKKIALVERSNPAWRDLYPEITEEGSCATAAQFAG